MNCEREIVLKKPVDDSERADETNKHSHFIVRSHVGDTEVMLNFNS